MKEIKLPWSEFKANLDSLGFPYFYIVKGSQYHIFGFHGELNLFTKVNKESVGPEGSDQIEWEDNYLSGANFPLSDLDITGRNIYRLAVTRKGWAFQLESIRVKLGKLDNSLVSTDHNGQDTGSCSLILRDKVDDNDSPSIINSQATADTDCTCTIVDYEPIGTDYDIIGGSVQQVVKPLTETLVYVVAVPDIPGSMGGSIAMVSGGTDLRYIDPADKIEADGRATKYLKYDEVYQTSKIRFKFHHSPPGLVPNYHEVMMNIYSFKGPSS